MSRVYRMHAGALEPPFQFQLTHGSPPVLIPDARIVNVHLLMGKEGSRTVDLGVCTKLDYADLVDPDPLFVPGPVWSYAWTVGQTDRPGRYSVLAQILWDTGKPQLVPNDGFFALEILKS